MYKLLLTFGKSLLMKALVAILAVALLGTYAIPSQMVFANEEAPATGEVAAPAEEPPVGEPSIAESPTLKKLVKDLPIEKGSSEEALIENLYVIDSQAIMTSAGGDKTIEPQPASFILTGSVPFADDAPIVALAATEYIVTFLGAIGQPGSLLDALDKAQPGDTIIISNTNFSFGNSNITINPGVTLVIGTNTKQNSMDFGSSTITNYGTFIILGHVNSNGNVKFINNGEVYISAEGQVLILFWDQTNLQVWKICLQPRKSMREAYLYQWRTGW